MYSFRFRRDDSFTWTKKNPVLGNGEPGYEEDTGLLKIGDGVSLWSELEYFYRGVPVAGGGGTVTDDALQAHINSLTPHPAAYDDGPSLLLIYQNAKV